MSLPVSATGSCLPPPGSCQRRLDKRGLDRCPAERKWLRSRRIENEAYVQTGYTQSRKEAGYGDEIPYSPKNRVSCGSDRARCVPARHPGNRPEHNDDGRYHRWTGHRQESGGPPRCDGDCHQPGFAGPAGNSRHQRGRRVPVDAVADRDVHGAIRARRLSDGSPRGYPVDGGASRRNSTLS